MIAMRRIVVKANSKDFLGGRLSTLCRLDWRRMWILSNIPILCRTLIIIIELS